MKMALTSFKLVFNQLFERLKSEDQQKFLIQMEKQIDKLRGIYE